MNYFLGYGSAKALRKLAECGREQAAIDRLERFEGDESDVRLAAEIYKRVGEGANAAHLLRSLAPEPCHRTGKGLTMEREVRRVPADWQHPRDEQGRYIPMEDQTYEQAAEKWLDALMAWERGEDKDRKMAEDRSGERYYWDWHGGPPEKTDSWYRPAFTEVPTYYQGYETVSEGTPFSPVFRTKEELARWISEHGTGGIGAGPMPYEHALAFVQAGSSPSLELTRDEQELIDAKQFIQAVKKVRYRLGLGLREAKQVVDRYRERIQA